MFHSGCTTLSLNPTTNPSVDARSLCLESAHGASTPATKICRWVPERTPAYNSASACDSAVMLGRTLLRFPPLAAKLRGASQYRRCRWTVMDKLSSARWLLLRRLRYKTTIPLLAFDSLSYPFQSDWILARRWRVTSAFAHGPTQRYFHETQKSSVRLSIELLCIRCVASRVNGFFLLY